MEILERKQHDLIVERRIQSLQAKLSNPSISALEEEFIKSKISYLQKLTNLPILMDIYNMTEDELKAMEGKYGTNRREEIIELCGLKELDLFVKRNKIIPLQYLKEAMLDDTDTMARLVELHEKNKEYQNKKIALQGIGLGEKPTYQRLYLDSKKLDAQERKVEDAIKDATENYNVQTLSEIQAYARDKSAHLSKSFILKHKSKVENNPRMKKLVDRLTGKGFLGKLDKFLPFRKKREQEFLDAVLESYNASDTLSILNIEKRDILSMSEKNMRLLARTIENQAKRHRNSIVEQRSKIKASKTEILEKIKEYDVAQNKAREEFMRLLSTKTKFLPKMFQEQIWAEPDLKSTLKVAACIKEEKDLIEMLNKSYGKNVEPLEAHVETVRQDEIDTSKVYRKQAA